MRAAVLGPIGALRSFDGPAAGALNSESPTTKTKEIKQVVCTWALIRTFDFQVMKSMACS